MSDHSRRSFLRTSAVRLAALSIGGRSMAHGLLATHSVATNDAERFVHRAWLGLNMNPSSATDVSYAVDCELTDLRMTCYVSNMSDPRLWGGPNRDQQNGPNARTVRQWFYYDVNQARLSGYRIVLVFHAMPANDPYGTTLPQFIADTIVPAPDADPNIRRIDDVVIAVQPGNENNIANPSFTPYLAGSTAYERGQSAMEMMWATTQALSNAGAESVQVWTAGAVLDMAIGPNGITNSEDFVRGLLSDPVKQLGVAGIAVHCYGYPPDHQASDWKDQITNALAYTGYSKAKYITEIGSESLRDGNESDGNTHVTNALYWLHDLGGNSFYTRAYWYSSSTEDGFGLVASNGAGGYTPRLAGVTFRDFAR